MGRVATAPYDAAASIDLSYEGTTSGDAVEVPLSEASVSAFGSFAPARIRAGLYRGALEVAIDLTGDPPAADTWLDVDVTLLGIGNLQQSFAIGPDAALVRLTMTQIIVLGGDLLEADPLSFAVRCGEELDYELTATVLLDWLGPEASG